MKWLPLNFNEIGDPMIEPCFFQPFPIKLLDDYPPDETMLTSEIRELLRFENFGPEKRPLPLHAPGKWSPFYRANYIQSWLSSQFCEIKRRNIEYPGTFCSLKQWEDIGYVI